MFRSNQHTAWVHGPLKPLNICHSHPKLSMALGEPRISRNWV